MPFFSISGSDFVEMFVGVGASRVRDLFDRGKEEMHPVSFSLMRLMQWQDAEEPVWAADMMRESRP